jgi:predicted nucleotidyltransferase
MNRLEEIKKKLVEIKPILQEKYKVKEIGIFGSYVR